jgi:hypothetical protein
MENRRGREGWSRLFSGEKQEEHLALVSGVLWGFEHPIDNTPGTWKVVSNNLRATDRGYANYEECPKGEVRRIPIPRTPVNNTLVVYLPIRFIADSPLRGIVAHKVCGRKEEACG